MSLFSLNTDRQALPKLQHNHRLITVSLETTCNYPCHIMAAQQVQPSIDSSREIAIPKKAERKRHGARNQHRHKFFVKWLIETFALSEDVGESPTHHILDVAGGKGEVSARLAMCHRRRVVMVDPRPADIVHCFESLVLPKIPKKWRERLESKKKQEDNFIERTIERRFRQLVTTFEESTLEDSVELRESVEKASLIVGLHADGATEAIVDAAMRYRKPFVVVPCCVFPNFFRQRQVFEKDTNKMVPVRSHDQFCDYLLAKDDRFRLEVLPFEGRNIAIWWDGK